MINEIEIASNNSRLLAVIFLILVLILLLIGLLIILPSAEIVFQVKSEPFIGEFQLKIDQSAEKPLYNLNMIPGSIYNLGKLEQKIDRNKYLTINYSLDGQEGNIIISRQHLNNFLNQQLANLTPIPKRILNQDILLTDYKIEDFDLKNGHVILTLTVQAEVIPNYDIELLKEFLSNKSKIEALNYLKSLPNVQNVKINSWSVFSDKLPLSSQRIKIKLNPQ